MRDPVGEICIRDPFVVPVMEEQMYYLFGSSVYSPDYPSFEVRRSRNLSVWSGPAIAFPRRPDFWSDRDYWAPEVHAYRGRWYLFGSFRSEDRRRGTQILVADDIGGPYRPHSDGPVTPASWECLDGTLFVDERRTPWMVFCHEWVQVGDGEICALRLSDDLREGVGDPVLLFRASAAPWTHEIGRAPRRGRVTDGPFVVRLSTGGLAMLWSSFGAGGYSLAVAYSDSGRLSGPWEHAATPVLSADGGHGMLFRTFGGDLALALHRPNSGRNERARFFRVEEDNGRLLIAAEGVEGLKVTGTDGWTPLFDGRTLTGWHMACTPKDRGKPYWRVDQGAILCDTGGDRDHDYVWLMSDQQFGDFELAMEVQVYRGVRGNSGVQVRSRYDYDANWLDGPQVDVDPATGWRTGLIYDETRDVKRWIAPSLPNWRIDPSHAAPGWTWRSAGDDGGWNQLRIHCRGRRIRTWVNGIPICDLDGARLLDDEVHRRRGVGLRGHIALQLHKNDDLRIRYRDIRVRVMP